MRSRHPGTATLRLTTRSVSARRNNASLPFNGNLYGLIIIGLPLSPDEMWVCERYGTASRDRDMKFYWSFRFSRMLTLAETRDVERLMTELTREATCTRRMSYVHRCLIVPAALAPHARLLTEQLAGPPAPGMFITPLSGRPALRRPHSLHLERPDRGHLPTRWCWPDPRDDVPPVMPQQSWNQA